MTGVTSGGIIDGPALGRGAVRLKGRRLWQVDAGFAVMTGFEGTMLVGLAVANPSLAPTERPFELASENAFARYCISHPGPLWVLWASLCSGVIFSIVGGALGAPGVVDHPGVTVCVTVVTASILHLCTNRFRVKAYTPPVRFVNQPRLLGTEAELQAMANMLQRYRLRWNERLHYEMWDAMGRDISCSRRLHAVVRRAQEEQWPHGEPPAEYLASRQARAERDRRVAIEGVPHWW